MTRAGATEREAFLALKEQLRSLCDEFSGYPEQVQAKVIEILGNQLARTGVSHATSGVLEAKAANRVDKNPPREQDDEFLKGDSKTGVMSFRAFCEARGQADARIGHTQLALSVSYIELVAKKLPVTLALVYTAWCHMGWQTGSYLKFQDKITSISNAHDVVKPFNETTSDRMSVSAAGRTFVEELLRDPKAKPKRLRVKRRVA